MMAFGIATTSAFTSRVPAGQGGGVGVACAAGVAAAGPTAAVAGVTGGASVFAVAAAGAVASVGSEAFVVVPGIFAGDAVAGVLASTIRFSTATFGVCARTVVTANKLRPSIVKEVTT
jgi:hypothetical protein